MVLAEEIRSHLNLEFQKKLQRNPRYSLRSFARDLGLEPSSVSQILRGKRSVPKKRLPAILSKLGLEDLDIKPIPNLSPPSKARFRRMNSAEFEPVSHWSFFAILELFELANFKSSPEWMADQLGIPTSLVEASLLTLQKAGLVHKNDKGDWAREPMYLTVGDLKVSTRTLREHQMQILEKSKWALENLEYETREHSSLVFAGASSQLPEAKKIIRKFKKQLGLLLQQKKSELNEIYLLQVALVPVTKRRGK